MEKKYRKPMEAGAVAVGCFVLYYKMLTDPAAPYWGIGLALSLCLTGLYLIGGFRFLKEWRKRPFFRRDLRAGKGQ
ncbi:MAG TPA: hypothetical protein VIL83_01470 [Capillibacterium sp.]